MEDFREEFLDLAFAGGFVLVTSPTLMDELDEKLRIKFELSSADAELIRNRLESTAEVVSTQPSLSVILDDPDDDRVLECAVAGRADIIVSGDRHLKELGTYDEIRILTVRQFIEKVRPVA